MSPISRRRFISNSVLGLAGASMLTPELLQGAPSTEKVDFIGFQSWVVREDIGKDLGGTLKKYGAFGYNQVEMCSPPGYSELGFGPLTKLKASEMKKIIHDAGFNCISCHYGFDELKNHGQERIDYAKELGLTQMVVSSFGLPKDATLDDWRKAAGALNPLGEQVAKSGLQLGYHNHNMEFEKLEGKLIYDEILTEMDPKLVKLQFQVWVIIAGYKAVDYFKKYPGRFLSAHLYDWSGKGEEMMPVGNGIVDWNEFFQVAKASGVKNYFVEMNQDMLKDSAAYLKKL
jgi:sugar phosphate isomerase/epimerase